ncbi:DUF998 domain-containing protein [Erwinia persicina]|uniref:DUF998 domain-containing protein n=1 Tax=Erwinia persicina TaxID=55211 RepID=UPI00210A7CBF|nr:DUF998 domain-containing protein [Erwinia persicina]MCQ4093182.1 DUF998 domain-containing protein [Erwinia persicina]MCQ4098950.1 DUF998 domain-containing protein [Erwinia persicina]
MLSLTGRQRAGALCFAAGGLLYLLAERLSALAWHHPAYRYSHNYISDLGIPGCGPQICSPLHDVMNAGFAAEGLLFILACGLLRRQIPGLTGGAALLAGGLHGTGGMLIALFHSGGPAAGITLHQIGAVMAIGGGNLCLIAVGLAGRRVSGVYASFSLILGVCGLVCMLAIPWVPVHVGLIERAAVYPITLWQIVTGVSLLLAGSRYRIDK